MTCDPQSLTLEHKRTTVYCECHIGEILHQNRFLMFLCLLQTRQNYDLCEGCRYVDEKDTNGPYEEIAPIVKVCFVICMVLFITAQGVQRPLRHDTLFCFQK